jgi:hypothetical protein
MTNERLYRIEEFNTTGWVIINQDDHHLTKEECNTKLNDYIKEGYNPNRLRVQVEG